MNIKTIEVMKTEFEKMRSQELYDFSDEEIEKSLIHAKKTCARLQTMTIFDDDYQEVLSDLIPGVPASVRLYVTHYPLIYCQMSWATTHKDQPASTHVFVAVCIFFLAIGIAYASLKLYDEPAREWLKQKLFSKKVV